MSSPEDPPPPYTAVASDHGPRYYYAPNCGSEHRPGPAKSGKWYHKDKRRQTMKFIYVRDPSRDFHAQDWVACLLVKCNDVPCLMRDGFFWGIQHVIHEDGYISPRHEWTGNTLLTRPLTAALLKLAAAFTAALLTGALTAGKTSQIIAF
ncbi:hypothetical protein F4678DRAFT_458921 [Xylaria arbuscula]|nr:hypothetical protein F4678DRAFT_458921 [Xylaria arbuscula]